MRERARVRVVEQRREGVGMDAQGVDEQLPLACVVCVEKQRKTEEAVGACEQDGGGARRSCSGNQNTRRRERMEATQ